jgi:deoxyribodipyrimidine photo-lyase
MPVIHWFRRDLRLTDNTALNAAVATGEAVIPVHVLSEWKGRHRWTGAPRQEFLCGCLRSLSQNIAAAGGSLIIRQGTADEELEKLIVETRASAIYFNRDPDPFGRKMEERVRALPCKIHDFKDVVMHERNEVMTASGTPFRVFTPYSKAWLKAPKTQPTKAPKKINTPAGVQSMPLPDLKTWGLSSTANIAEPGEKAARTRLTEFLRGPILKYGAMRNTPFGRTTSHLSADLRHGTLSIREIYQRCTELAENATAFERKSIAVFINELIWREFYMQILWHYPEVLEHEFNPKWRALKWRTGDEKFRRWCDGETGFPIVDAGMRELNETGYMHYRVRMIVAMFLTKDLHIDWREGEKYFMQRLVDGEIASNNGGWQWSAGTGADAAPYFRIQNPWSQTQRYDPEGKYIKQWVPELRDVEAAKFMEPPDNGASLARNYPPPVVDHAVERDVTLEMFRE